jgi:hypothetical protein
MIDEMERIWKETVMACLKYCPGIRLEGLSKPQRTSVKIVGVPPEIWTEHLPDGSAEFYSQNYWVFGLCPSSGFCIIRRKTKFRKLDLWLTLAFCKGPNRVGVSPHLRTDTDRVSETSCFSCNYLESGRWTKSGNPVILCVIHHRQNPIESTELCCHANLLGPSGDRHGYPESDMIACFRATCLHQMSLAYTSLGDAPSREHTPCAVCGRVKTAWRWSWNLTRRLRVCWRPRRASLLSAPVSRHVPQCGSPAFVWSTGRSKTECSAHSCEGATGGVGEAQLGLYSSPWMPLVLGRKSKLKNKSMSFIVVVCPLLFV